MSSKRIVVTRPEAQSGPWSQQLQAKGYDTVAVPVLEIAALEDDAHIQALKGCILALDDYAVLIFVSQNAVEYGFDWIEDYWPQFPTGIACLAIGAKTEQAMAERLAKLGIPAQNMNEDSSRMDSEALLTLPCLQNVSDTKVLIFRGVGGRTKLLDSLQARGAKVKHCELYRRLVPSAAKQQLRDIQLTPGRDIVTLFSGESLQNFDGLLAKTTIQGWEALDLVVPSKRVADMALSMGYRHVALAKNATEGEMYKAIQGLSS